MLRSSLLRPLLALGLLVGGCQQHTSQETAAKPAQPNVVLIYADNLGYGDVSANG